MAVTRSDTDAALASGVPSPSFFMWGKFSGRTIQSPTLQKVAPEELVSTHAGDGFLLALTVGGRVLCLGANPHGCLGLGEGVGVAPAWTEVKGLENIVEVGMGRRGSCGKTTLLAGRL